MYKSHQATQRSSSLIPNPTNLPIKYKQANINTHTCTLDVYTHQVISEGLESLLRLLDLVWRSFQNDLVEVRVELYVHLGEVLGDLLNVLSLSSDDESMEPAGGIHPLRLDTVGLAINLGEGFRGSFRIKDIPYSGKLSREKIFMNFAIL